MSEMYIRKAKMQDVKSIHSLLMGCSNQGLLLPRSLNDLYGKVRDFSVAVRREDDTVLGCCALAPTWEDMAEIRSLAVNEPARSLGLGVKLVETCISEAVTLGLYRIFTLTYVPGFFTRFGFGEVEKHELPQKVWADCLNCPKFPDCDEVAMLLDL